jgi:predicted patatin/cPLA2 family phospholipase
MNNNIGLVLEGGGMRGAFTCGVLDYLIDNHIKFPYGIGVSAGAGNGLSYISNQKGRGKYTTVDLMRGRQYISVSNLVFKGSLIDMNLLYEELPQKLYPYDFEAYKNNPAEYAIVTTNCETGKACYFQKQDTEKKLVQIARASGSLPYISPIITIDGIPMLDGGLADSIPVKRAMEKGYKNCVVVLTRNKGYRKKRSHFPMPDFMYRKYPLLQETLKNRHALYNQQLDLVDQLENEGKILVIRPKNPVEVDRIEKDAIKLEKLYLEGSECAKSANIEQFIKRVENRV